jgi:hypothetical protein
MFGVSRSTAGSYTSIVGGASATITSVSQTPLSANYQIFGSAAAGYTDARLSFYSIGESLDLALLDARVTALMNALAAAIP